jgi:hypothetical protein
LSSLATDQVDPAAWPRPSPQALLTHIKPLEGRVYLAWKSSPMDEERSKRPVREWIGPWIENWPAGHPETRKRIEEHELSGRLEQALEEVDELLTELAELKARAPSIGDLEAMVERALERTRSEESGPAEQVDGHLLFLPSGNGYRLEERAGPPPLTGSSLTLDNGRGLMVVKQGPSPLPGDTRRCAYLASLRG